MAEELGKLTQDKLRNQAISAFASYFAPIKGATAITPSNTVTVAAGRQFAVFCTVPGNVKVGFSGGGTLTFPVIAGYQKFDWSIVQVFATGTTATAVYANLS